MKEELNRVLEEIGFGRYHYWLFVVAGSVFSRQGWFNDMNGIYIGTVFFTSAGEEWNLSETQKGILASIFILGTIVGSVVCGYIADRKGRIYIFKKTILIFGGSLVFLLVCINSYMAGCALFCFGFGLGAEASLGGTVFQEFCPPSKQHLLAILGLNWSIASVLTNLVAAAFSVASLPLVLWRCMCVYGICTSALFFILRIKLPETPMYLVNNNRITDAEKVLQEMNKYNKRNSFISLRACDLRDASLSNERIVKPPSIEEIADSISNKQSEKLISNEDAKNSVSNEHLLGKKENINQFAEIWKPEYLKMTILISITYFLADITSIFIYFFLPDLLKQAGVTGALIYLTVAIQQSFGIPANFLASYFIDTRCGRKYTIVFFMAMCGIMNLGLIFARSYWELVLCISLFSLGNYAGFSALYTIAPESYKTNVRNTGVGWANASSKSGGLVGPLVGGIILDMPNGFYISVVLACSMAVLLGFIAVFMNETRGKSLE